MKCPACQDQTLQMSERQGVEIDYCPKCRGVWLDRGELDKIVDRMSGDQATPGSSPAPGSSPGPAPGANPVQPAPGHAPGHAPGYGPGYPPPPRRPDDSDYGYHQYKGYKKRKHWLLEIFD